MKLKVKFQIRNSLAIGVLVIENVNVTKIIFEIHIHPVYINFISHKIGGKVYVLTYELEKSRKSSGDSGN